MAQLKKKNILFVASTFLISWSVMWEAAEAKGLRMRVGTALGGRGGGRGGSRGGNKPWNTDRERFNLNYDDDGAGGGLFGIGGRSKAPCVGLCYYMKLLELGEKQKEEAKKIQDDDPYRGQRQWSLGELEEEEEAATTTLTPYHRPYPKPYPWELPRKKACVGLCYYYKKLGIPNPHDKMLEDIGIKPRGGGNTGDDGRTTDNDSNVNNEQDMAEDLNDDGSGSGSGFGDYEYEDYDNHTQDEEV